MKQSLIIVLIICFALGESFSFIVKQDKKAEKTPRFCCNKSCNQQQQKGKKNSNEHTVLPVVNLLPYSL